jgi:hypothetical protein
MLSKTLEIIQCRFVLVHPGGLLTTAPTIPDRLEFRNETDVCWRIGVNNENVTNTCLLLVVFYHQKIHEPNDQPLSILNSKENKGSGRKSCGATEPREDNENIGLRLSPTQPQDIEDTAPSSGSKLVEPLEDGMEV